MLKDLIINDAGSYNSDKNYAEGNLASNPRIATHTSDVKKINVMDTTNVNSPQKYRATGPSQSSPQQLNLRFRTEW